MNLCLLLVILHFDYTLQFPWVYDVNIVDLTVDLIKHFWAHNRRSLWLLARLVRHRKYMWAFSINFWKFILISPILNSILILERNSLDEVDFLYAFVHRHALIRNFVTETAIEHSLNTRHICINIVPKATEYSLSDPTQDTVAILLYFRYQVFETFFFIFLKLCRPTMTSLCLLGSVFLCLLFK